MNQTRETMVSWQDQLPESWVVRALKRVAFHTVSNVDKIPSADEEPVRLCNYTNVYKNDYISLNLDFMANTATLEEIKKFGLLKNDVIITKDSESWDDIAIPALVVETAEDLVCGYHLALLRPDPQFLEGRFLFRCLQAKVIRLFLELESTGVTRFGLPKDAIGSLPLPLPPLELQQRIADYLDAETTHIDQLIQEKEKMLELLEEKRAALISRVVTKGLDDRVPMKESGLEWIDMIPAHWRVLQLKRTWISADYGISDDIRGNGTIKILRMSCIVNGKIDLENAGQVEEVDPYLYLEPNDILFNRTNSLDQVAKVGILDQKPQNPTSFASYLVRIRTNEFVLPNYLVYLLNSSSFITFARSNAVAAISQANLNPTKYGEIHVALPPGEEQEKIIEMIQNHELETQQLSKELKLSLELLRERRSALITATVTGQLAIE